MADGQRRAGLCFLICAVGAFGWMGAAIAAEAPGAEQPVPPAADQEQARKLIREVHKPEYDAAKTPAQRSALAKKMLGEAAKSGDDPAGCYVLYCTARDVAVQAGDVETALAAVDQLAAVFKVDALPMKEEVLQSLGKPPATPEQLVLVAEQAFVLVEEAVAADNYEAAGRLGDLALAAARRTRNVEAVRQITARNTQVAAMAREYAQVKEAMVTLDQKLTDPRGQPGGRAILVPEQGPLGVGRVDAGLGERPGRTGGGREGHLRGHQARGASGPGRPVVDAGRIARGRGEGGLEASGGHVV